MVVVLYGQGIAIQRDKLWARLRGIGRRVPLRLENVTGTEPFLRALFASGSPGRVSPSFGPDPAKACPQLVSLDGDALAVEDDDHAAGRVGGVEGLIDSRLQRLEDLVDLVPPAGKEALAAQE